MTKIVCISDTHTRRIENMPEGDILVHTGDYTGRGSITNLCEFVNWLDELDYKHKICISGNHDFNGETEPTLTKEIFKSADIHYLDDSGIEINGLKFWGSPVSPTFGNWAFNRGPIEIREHWDLIPEDTNVLLTHCPPFEILDKLSMYGSAPGKHVGCNQLRWVIENKLKNLKLNVFGHIHEGYGQTEINGVKFINASSLDEHYQLKNKPIVIEL